MRKVWPSRCCRRRSSPTGLSLAASLRHSRETRTGAPLAHNDWQGPCTPQNPHTAGGPAPAALGCCDRGCHWQSQVAQVSHGPAAGALRRQPPYSCLPAGRGCVTRISDGPAGCRNPRLSKIRLELGGPDSRLVNQAVENGKLVLISF